MLSVWKEQNLTVLWLHGMSVLLQAFFNVVKNLHCCLRNSGAWAEDTADAATVEEFVVLKREENASELFHYVMISKVINCVH